MDAQELDSVEGEGAMRVDCGKSKSERHDDNGEEGTIVESDEISGRVRKEKLNDISSVARACDFARLASLICILL